MLLVAFACLAFAHVAHAQESSSVPAAASSEAAKADSSAASSAQGDAGLQGEADGESEGEGEGGGASVESSSEGGASSQRQPVDNPANLVNPHQTPDNSFLYDTSIDELTQADASFQGNIVQVMGEVIGDSLVAEEDAGKHWITLETLEEGRASSISVLIDDEYLGLIDTYGGYHSFGAILQVRGTFNLTCPSHEGIMDIHADRVVLVSNGYEISEPFDIGPFVPGALLVVFGIALTVLFSHLREREL